MKPGLNICLFLPSSRDCSISSEMFIAFKVHYLQSSRSTTQTHHPIRQMLRFYAFCLCPDIPKKAEAF